MVIALSWMENAEAIGLSKTGFLSHLGSGIFDSRIKGDLLVSLYLHVCNSLHIVKEAA